MPIFELLPVLVYLLLSVATTPGQVVELEIPLRKSLIHIKKRIGPKIVPCGTPDVTLVQVEKEPRTTTRCERLVRKFPNQFSKTTDPLLFQFI